MNGTGTNYDEEAVVLTLQNGFPLQACVMDQISRYVGDGEVIGEDRRRDEGINPGNAEVVCFVGRRGGKLVALVL